MANLESRLQDLSESVGTYDRLRQVDQQAMQKLKERITQLDQENQSLMVHKEQDLDGDNDSNLDVQSLIERILRLVVNSFSWCWRQNLKFDVIFKPSMHTPSGGGK